MVYVADWGNERIVTFDADGGMSRRCAARQPTPSGRRHSCPSTSKRRRPGRRANMEPEIEFFNDDPHEVSSHIEKFFWAPTSVKLDSEGRMYVTESNRHRVQIYRRNGD